MYSVGNGVVAQLLIERLEVLVHRVVLADFSRLTVEVHDGAGSAILIGFPVMRERSLGESHLYSAERVPLSSCGDL